MTEAYRGGPEDGSLSRNDPAAAAGEQQQSGILSGFRMEDRKLRLAIVIPTVKRKMTVAGKEGGTVSPRYLTTTVNSVIAKMAVEDHQRVRILIFNANIPPDEYEEVKEILAAHDQYVSGGEGGKGVAPSLVEIANHESYTQLHDRGKDLQRNWGDSLARILWRSKQCLDFAQALRVCLAMESEYVLLLEDDVIATDHFVPKILTWMDEKFKEKKDWLFISLFSTDYPIDGQLYEYGMCSQALLFRNDVNLSHLIEYIEVNFDKSPVDWLLRDYVRAHHWNVYVRVPSLFQHIGVVRSLSEQEGSRLSYPVSPTFREHDDFLSVVWHRLTLLVKRSVAVGRQMVCNDLR